MIDLLKKTDFEKMKDKIEKHTILNNEHLFDSFTDWVVLRRYHLFKNVKVSVTGSYGTIIKIKYLEPRLEPDDDFFNFWGCFGFDGDERGYREENYGFTAEELITVRKKVKTKTKINTKANKNKNAMPNTKPIKKTNEKLRKETSNKLD